eukprot:COSAG02_NODE_978_length_15497_cov_11.288349_9_plen_63_part_00
MAVSSLFMNAVPKQTDKLCCLFLWIVVFLHRMEETRSEKHALRTAGDQYGKLSGSRCVAEAA